MRYSPTCPLMLSLSLILLVSALHAAPVELSDSFDGSPGLETFSARWIQAGVSRTF